MTGRPWEPPADPDRVDHVRRTIDSALGTDPAHWVFARSLVEDGILDKLIAEAAEPPVCEHGAALPDLCAAATSRAETADRLAAVEEIAAPAWRTNRGHHFEDTATAYAAGRNEIVDQLRAALYGDTTLTPAWVHGWKAAMDWLAEHKGADGIALAEEMRTRLPEDCL